MTIQQTILRFLKQLELAVPPPPNCHHAITYAQYGTDEAGWDDKLALQVNWDGVFHCFFLDVDDFERDTLPIIAEIWSSLVNPTPTDQHGVALGQYLARFSTP